MTLSNREQQAFEQIAEELYAKAPRLDPTRVRDRATAPTRRQRILAGLVMVVGASMMMGAVLVPKTIPGGLFALALLGYCVMFGAALLWCGRPSHRDREVTSCQ
ncbi:MULTISPECIES: DUF3040 domain-containing protein [Mycobacteriaceae]|uniref:DUF3040 domain-containing protein n=1 Tax=Mycobacteriaceae TaxID=1762 RepID=UPI0014151B51